MTTADKMYELMNASFQDAGVTRNRTNPVPLDKTSVYRTLEEAVNYALTSVVAYPGQIITVLSGGGEDGTESTTWKTNADGTITRIDAEVGKASKDGFGIVKIGGNIEVEDGVISVRPATISSLGVVKIGTGLDVAADGTISAQKLSVDQDFSDKTSENPVSTKAVNNELTAHYVNKDVVEGTASSTDKIQKKSDVSADIKKAIEDLDYAGITAQQGEFISSISETDGVITAQKGTIALPTANVVGLDTKMSELDATDAWLSGYTNTKFNSEQSDRISSINALSVELKGDIGTEKTRAEESEQAITTKVEEISSKFETVSADHQTRITTVEEKVAKLSSAMHFRGVIEASEIEAGQTIEQALVAKFKPCQSGDLALYLTDGTEFVYASELSAEASGWYILGDEGTYATKAALQAEKERAEGVEGGLRTDVNAVSTDLDTLEGDFTTLTATTLPLSVNNLISAIDSEKERAEGVEGEIASRLATVSTDLDTLEGDFTTLTATTLPLSVNNLISAIDSEKSARESADSALDGKIQTLSGVSILSVKMNGQYFETKNNVAELTISCINCGGAVEF